MILAIEGIGKDELQQLITDAVRQSLQDYTPTNTHTPDERLLNTEEAAELLKVSQLTLLNWRKTGKLPALKIGGRYYYKLSAILSQGAI